MGGEILNKRKLILVSLIVVSVLLAVPVVQASLFRTYLSVRVYRDGLNFRVKTARWQASYYGASQPTRAYKLTIYRKLDGQRYYSIIKNSYYSMGSYRMKLRGLALVMKAGPQNKYVYSLQPGAYKVKIWFASNCDYQGITKTVKFSLG